MSIRATTWAWSLDLPSTVKMVLLAIADRHNARTGDCYPSHATLVKMTGLSLSAVKIAIRKLDTMGLISRSQRSCHRSGRTVGVVYLLAITDAPRHDVDGEGAHGDHPEGARGDHPYSEREKGTGSEPAGADKAAFRDDRPKARNYQPMSRAHPSGFKSGAAQLLWEMQHGPVERPRQRRFKSGALRRLQEIHAEQARDEAEGGVVVDADYWSDETIRG